jgi:hypothetical protein
LLLRCSIYVSTYVETQSSKVKLSFLEEQGIIEITTTWQNSFPYSKQNCPNNLKESASARHAIKQNMKFISWSSPSEVN